MDHGEGDYGLGPFMEQTASDIVDSEIEEWDMYLELNNGMVKIGDESGSSIDAQPMLSKVEVCYTRGIEKILSELRGPLEVTYTVDPREVAENLQAWTPAIRKEVDGVSVAICRLLPVSDTKAEWLHRKGAQRLPTKFVFTIRPGDSPQPGQPHTWFKRKARLVVCGNFAAADDSSLYSETAPSESVRMGLVVSRKKKWMVGLIGILSAFLRTPLDHERGAPTVIVAPPKLLERLQLIAVGELWGLIRAPVWAETSAGTVE